jgi:glutaredoxin
MSYGKMPAKPHVIFYTKPGCHLCDEARREIALAGCAGLFTYEEVDINSDPELLRRYGWDIPVVLIGSTHAFKHRLTAEDFRRALLRAGETS